MGLDDVEISYMTLEDIDDVMVVEKLSFTIPWSKNALIEEVIRYSSTGWFSFLICFRFLLYLTNQGSNVCNKYGCHCSNLRKVDYLCRT